MYFLISRCISDVLIKFQGKYFPNSSKIPIPSKEDQLRAVREKRQVFACTNFQFTTHTHFKAPLKW